MVELIEKVRQERDSLGGIIECFALNLPPGVGDPIFGGMEPPRLASIVYSIPPLCRVFLLVRVLMPAVCVVRSIMIFFLF